MANLHEAIRLNEEARRTLARARTVPERMEALKAMQSAFDLLASAVAESETWSVADEAAFADFTARWES
jgi:hypothetical protein